MHNNLAPPASDSGNDEDKVRASFAIGSASESDEEEEKNNEEIEEEIGKETRNLSNISASGVDIRVYRLVGLCLYYY